MGTSKKKSALGDNILGGGLDALFGQQGVTTTSATNDTVRELPLTQIVANPYQPRHVFNEGGLRDLANSIKENGILQPIIVRHAPEDASRYEIMAGERRFRASQLAGKETIPAVVRAYDNQTMMQAAILENLQREDLSPIEEAAAYKMMMETMRLTQEQVAKRLGKARSAVANILRLLTLPQEVQDWIQAGDLSMGQGRTLLGLHNKRRVVPVAKRVMNEGMTVRQLETLVNQLNEAGEQKPMVAEPTPFIRETQHALEDKFGTKVKISRNQRGAGKIEISYLSDDDLNRIFDVLNINLD
ncbi:ParB/RepB/Spo0J family partition protein [Weissella diestrammenae]|uniref:ParB/RepB/Spo0J family partition protein n=1 Tax=Weissella diestrammenae TaxID=1162633 RepID=A0A7G9T745_9LACO|nr:ParB/RepB/Spo0J family partition protein [Weissella diestrammenae]MCM0582481.1 ParB/RepB/Spo0J family partition protein [Weissella diestrammenae]QNN75920.1 ParB/RepB/Spo0J family partition protein [Weissella diestrammenae]